MKYVAQPWRVVGTVSNYEDDYLFLESCCKDAWNLVQQETTLAIHIGDFDKRATTLMAQYFPIVYAISQTRETLSPLIENLYFLDLLDKVLPIHATPNCLMNHKPLGAELIYIDSQNTDDQLQFCADVAMGHLSDRGFLVLHNTDRWVRTVIDSLMSQSWMIKSEDDVKEYKLSIAKELTGQTNLLTGAIALQKNQVKQRG
jgi:hypothetical protein